MTEKAILTYIIKDSAELNLSYIPFVQNGGLFIPTTDSLALGDKIVVDLQIPEKNTNLKIEGKIIWITPPNALHHVLAGVGIQFTGSNAQANDGEIKALLAKGVAVGGYTYGMMEDVGKA